MFSGKVGGFAIGMHFTSLSQASRTVLEEYLRERHAHQAFQRGDVAPRVQKATLAATTQCSRHGQ